MKFHFLLIFFTVLISTGIAQKINNFRSYRFIQNQNYLRLSYDNDLFVGTDQNYTQGTQLEISGTFLKSNPINHLFFKIQANRLQYTLTLDQLVYTPKNIKSKEIQFLDRPFSATLFLGSGLSQFNEKRKLIVAQYYNLGILGPQALGNETQTLIHKHTDNPIPHGWGNQIKSDLIFDYGINIEKNMILWKNIFSLQTHSSVELGTLRNNISVGSNLQLGKLNSMFKQTNSNLQCYLVYDIFVLGILFDASLQGGLTNQNSIYVLNKQNIKRITLQQNLAMVLQSKRIYAEVGVSFLTKEFDKGIGSGWGGLKFGYKF